MPNIELLERTLQHIIENEEGWNQRIWRSVPGLNVGRPELLPTMCGTAMCFAGEAIQLNNPKEWVVKAADIKRAKKAGDAHLMSRMNDMLEYVHAKSTDSGVVLRSHPVTGQDIWVKFADPRGREVLDLDHDTASRLFYEGNSLRDLTSAVAYIKEHGNLEGWDRPDRWADDDE